MVHVSSLTTMLRLFVVCILPQIGTGFFRPLSTHWIKPSTTISTLDPMEFAIITNRTSHLDWFTPDTFFYLSEMLSNAAHDPNEPLSPYEKKLEEKRRNFTMNVGRAKEILKEDIPHIFERKPRTDIFTDDIILKDPMGIIARGKQLYSMVFASLRVMSTISAMNPTVAIQSIRYNDYDRCISVRWSVVTHGKFETMQIDAISRYKLNADGFIYEHQFDDLNDQEHWKPNFIRAGVVQSLPSVGGNRWSIDQPDSNYPL